PSPRPSPRTSFLPPLTQSGALALRGLACGSSRLNRWPCRRRESARPAAATRAALLRVSLGDDDAPAAARAPPGHKPARSWAAGQLPPARRVRNAPQAPLAEPI